MASDPDDMREGFAAALTVVDDLLDDACAEHSMKREEAVVAGFSQGGGLAFALGLGSERPAASGGRARDEPVRAARARRRRLGSGQGIPVLLQHGTDDPMVKVANSRELAELLVEQGVPVVYGEYPMGHEVALESVQQGRAWLEAIRAGERPSEPLPAPPPESPVKPVTTAEFDTEVLGSDVPVIVDFWAPWCGPCRQVGPIVEQIALMRKGAYKVVKVNIDEEPTLAQRYDVQSIPLIGLFRNGRLERASLGAKPRPQLEAELGMLVIP